MFVMFLICYFSFIFRCHLCAYCPGHEDRINDVRLFFFFPIDFFAGVGFTEHTRQIVNIDCRRHTGPLLLKM